MEKQTISDTSEYLDKLQALKGMTIQTSHAFEEEMKKIHSQKKGSPLKVSPYFEQEMKKIKTAQPKKSTKNQVNQSQNKETKKMTDLNTINKASDMRVIVIGEPKVATIVPKTGDNAGKTVTVLNVDCYRQRAEHLPDGKWKKLDTEFYKLQRFSDNAKDIAENLKDGLALRVTGPIKESSFVGRDGLTKTVKTIFIDNWGIDLNQRGLKGINFEKKNREQQQQPLTKSKEPSMEI